MSERDGNAGERSSWEFSSLGRWTPVRTIALSVTSSVAKVPECPGLLWEGEP